MDCALPEGATLATALGLVVRAPTMRAGRPWRWRVHARSLDLSLDADQAEAATEVEQRGLILSCGAALHHLRIAAAALGWVARVRRAPRVADPNHLATVELLRHRPTALDSDLSAAITSRQSDHRHYGQCPVPHGFRTLVSERVVRLGGAVHEATGGPRDQLLAATDVVAGSETGSPDGAEFLVVSTAADDRAAWLDAGEALSAMVLTSTTVGLASCLLGDALEDAVRRADIRAAVLHDLTFPQAVVRVGWPPIPLAQLPRPA
ncbi:NAD(P)H nitroreductase [Nocardia sp. NPDC048505]|uniref:NAD(P)H nitroreductase n=1 Tax=unclassified Nocardia TaxID=2637762 RepID=UPI0033C515BC